MKEYSSVDELRRDFSDMSRRLDGYKGGGSSISDSNLTNDLRDFGARISSFVGRSGSGGDRPADRSSGTERGSSGTESRGTEARDT